MVMGNFDYRAYKGNDPDDNEMDRLREENSELKAIYYYLNASPRIRRVIDRKIYLEERGFDSSFLNFRLR